MSESSSTAYKTVQETLQQIKEKLLQLSATDLTKTHVDQEWSWMPHVKDHLEFLAEQVGGIADHLRDAPPPETPEEIKAIRESMADGSQKVP